MRILDRCRQIRDTESGRVLLYRDEVEAVLTAGDCISRRQAIDRFVKLGDYYNGRDEVKRGIHQCIAVAYELPSAQPTLYGYKIEHLAYIAMVMEKEGVTADYAVRTFDDMGRAIKMIIDEAQQKVEEALNE